MNQEIYQALLNSPDEEEMPKPRRVVKEVVHQTEVGELVYRYFGKNAPQLLYLTTSNFVSDRLSKGYLWWAIENKIRAIFDWGKNKGVHPMAVVKVLNKAIKEE